MPKPSPAENGAAAGTQALLRGLRVLEQLASSRTPVGVGELAKIVELPKSTVQRLLKTLEVDGWAATSGEPITRWQVGERVYDIFGTAPVRKDIREIAMPHLRVLAAQTRETVHLTVANGQDQNVLIDRVDSPQPVRTFNEIGTAGPLWTTSSGKAWLAALDDEDVERILAEPLVKLTERTVVDKDELLRQIAEIRQRRFAVNFGENRDGVCAVGAAVVQADGLPVAGIAVSIPAYRFGRESIDELGKLVVATADEIAAEYNL